MNSSYTKIGTHIVQHLKGVTPQYVEESTVIVLNQKCIRNNRIDYSFAQFVNSAQKISSEKYLKVGDLLVNSTGQGTAGRCAYVNTLPRNKKVVIDSHILILRFDNKILAKCIGDVLFSNEELIQTFLEGSSGQSELDRVRLFNLNFKIPSDNKTLNLQANFSQNIIDKTVLNYQIISELEIILKRIYYYWFVQFDFPNEEGKPYKSSGGKMVWNEKLKKEIPLGWSVDKISSLIEQNKGGDWGKDEPMGNYIQKVSCIRGADINYIKGNDSNSDLPERYILEKNSHKLLSANDIVIEISGGSPTQSTGRAAMITEKTIERFDNPLICSNFCQAITLKDANQAGYFFYMWSMFYEQNIFFNYEGKTSGIKNFLFDSFVANEWYIPSQAIAYKFQQIVDSIYKKKESLLKQNKHLTACRDWLLPLLMSGQVKVKPQIEESVLNIAAEPVAEYEKRTRTIPVDAHILGGHIVNRLHKSRGMGRTKLQKALHLVEYHCQMELNSQSMQFAAGPHDQEMMNYIDQKFFQFQHVKKEKEYINGKTHYKYIPTNRIQEIECAYENISNQKRKEIDNLLDKIATMDLAQAEIVSTLYAVWNNRLIAKQAISEDYLLQDFYDWSKHKHDFPKELVLKALDYMREEGITPIGWGKYIDKRE